MARCVICERITSGSLEFCGRHYKDYKEDILLKKPWVREMKNEAQRQRRQREREFADTSLDEIMDRYLEKSY